MKQFDQITTEEPPTPLLDQVKIPEMLRGLSETQLPQLADELREWLLYTVGKTGGHFGAGLGVVELTIALHYVFRTPDDRLVWDVGHQAYPHKILTGRREAMSSLRQWGGIGAFPSRDESHYDTFGVGHSSTSISAALGMAMADQLDGQRRKTVAIIGDGAMTGGMAFEALAHAGHEKTNLLVVLNDNQMSISENVGGLSNYFARIWASRAYNHLKNQSKRLLKSKPTAFDIARRTEEHVKGLVSGSTLFEELGFNYIGPINGHDLSELTLYLKKVKDLDGPQLLHVITQKGRGFTPAEQDPVGYHALNKLETKAKPLANKIQKKKTQKRPTFSNVFGQWVCDMADIDSDLVAVTPAMREGSDLVAFSKQYPDRYFDVAIAEQHAVTFAAGLACNGKKPVVAIYSTFFQRAYDQLIHDVAIQNLNVLFAVDRAGLVGEDGATHNGAFDLSFLRCIPNMVLMTPSDEYLCRQMLFTGFTHVGPAAVRYPRGAGPGVDLETQMTPMALGRGHIVREGQKVAILAFGPLLHVAKQAADALNLTLVDMRFVKPLDEALILDMALRHEGFVTLEENVVAGGAGAAVAECLNRQGVSQPVRQLGLPDSFLGHGQVEQLRAQCGLDEAGILGSLVEFLEDLGKIPTLVPVARVQIN